jgi:hypothetical protein
MTVNMMALSEIEQSNLCNAEQARDMSSDIEYHNEYFYHSGLMHLMMASRMRPSSSQADHYSRSNNAVYCQYRVILSVAVSVSNLDSLEMQCCQFDDAEHASFDKIVIHGICTM